MLSRQGRSLLWCSILEMNTTGRSSSLIWLFTCTMRSMGSGTKRPMARTSLLMAPVAPLPHSTTTSSSAALTCRPILACASL